jgi:hypothetical protein
MFPPIYLIVGIGFYAKFRQNEYFQNGNWFFILVQKTHSNHPWFISSRR